MHYVVVSVAEVNIGGNLCIIDLSKSPPLSNPFTDESPQYEVELEDLLMALGWELGRPLRRADDPRDYLPCQKLVRRVQKRRLYHGIRYPSAMAGRGTNVVLFDAMLARIGASKLVEISEVDISYQPFTEE